MATSFQGHVHHSFEPFAGSLTSGGRKVPGLSSTWGNSSSSTAYYSSFSSPVPLSGLGAGTSTTALTDLVHSLKPHSNSAMGLSTTIGADHERLLEWIRSERMHKLPPEGSSYDKVLICAKLFVERLHSFEGAIQHFAHESHLASQLAYIYCASLLEFGEGNADALLDLFNFFYRCSVALDNLVSRAELFAVSQAIKDQVILALADLVTLVVGIAIHSRKRLDLQPKSVTIDIHTTFAGSIESFRTRCEHVSELMWKHQLLQEGLVEGRGTEIKTIREWLEPEDPVLTQVTKFTAQFAQEREESTCLWLNPYIMRFLKSDQKVFTITGKPGSGKSILATVINDQLQHPIGGVSYMPLFVPINSRIPALTTPAAVAKSLLSQLFASRIGNISLYRTLSDAYTRCRQAVDEDKFVDVLWDAIKTALPACLKGARETVLIVDGVDEASCGQQALLQRLNWATANASNLRLIVLAAEEPKGIGEQSLVRVTPEQIFDDIAAVVRRVFKCFAAFNGMAAEEREICVTRIVKAANGSFVWAKLASKKLRDENPSDLGKAVSEFVKADHTIRDLVSHTLKSNTSQGAEKIVGWLATAARPLATWELSALLSVSLEKGIITECQSDPRALLKPLASLVFVQNNLIYLRHGHIRTAVLEALSRKEPKSGTKEMHTDFLQRITLYIKKAVTGKEDLSLDPIDPHHASTLLGRYPLLDFAIRYWLGHTRIVFDCNTSQGISNGAKKLHAVLPDSPLVALLEMTLWRNKSTPTLLLLYNTRTRLYEQVLGSKHPATLQTILCQALFYQTIQTAQPTQASQIFYNAAVTCQQVLSTQNIITMQITELFLESTSSQVTISRTEIMVKRIEMLRLLVECYKIHYGNTSEVVMSTLSQLVDHYTSINETQEAQKLTAILQGRTEGTGPEYVPARRPSDESLIVQLHGPKGPISHGTVLALDDVEQDELISTSFDFDALFALAEKYAQVANFVAAEQTFVNLWQRVSKAYRLQQSLEWELRSLRVIQAYSKFLLSHSRHSEVASLLSSFWAEHQQTMSSYEEVVTQFVAVAELMTAAKLSWMALEVLKQSAQSISHQSSLYTKIHEHIQTTLKEVKHTEASFASTATESYLEEVIFEESVDSSVTTTATHTLVQMYWSQHRWADATKLTTSDFQPKMSNSALTAQKLRDCYTYRRHTVKEEDVCLRLYRALRRDRPAQDKVTQTVAHKLIQLYERTRQTEKLVSIHVDILNDYSVRFKNDHQLVLQQLWILAKLTSPQAASVGYYRRIFEILNKNSDICDSRAFEPLVIVVTELVKQEDYPGALRPCQILFNSLQKPDINAKLRDATFVKSVYERYIRCLQMTHANSHVIHEVTVQYRKACLAVFGAKAAITIHATQTLAFIAQEFKQYETEAIELFESLLEMHSSEVDIDHENIRITLDAIYEAQEDMESTTVELSSHQIKQIVTARIKRLTTLRETYGWAHESSISQMQEVISVYEKQKETQAAVSLLQETAVQIVSSEQFTSHHAVAAERIASSYKAIGQVQQAKKLTSEIYQQLVAKDTTNVTSVGFDLSSSHRHSLLFLAQLEYSLREREESSLTMVEIYSSLVAEQQYFERFRKEIHSKSSTLQITIGIVSHLRVLLLGRGQTTTSSRVVEQFTDYFMSTQGQKLGLNRSQAVIFLSTILDHFQLHSSQNFLRSIALASHSRVGQLLQSGDQDRIGVVCDLALSTFHYLRAHDGFSSLAPLKLLFKMSLAISNSAIRAPQAPDSKQMLQVSATIIKEILGHCKTQNIDLAQLDALHLNSLIKVLGKQKDYRSLSWLLTALWDKRQKSRATTSDDTYTLALGRMLAITLYLVGDYPSSMRLAEDLVYNCARVHGPRHASTVEMTVLLSQMYTSVAQGYQKTADHRELATQYYKKAAALHENALRVFVDPSSAPTAIDTDIDEPSSPSSSGASSPGEPGMSPGKSVRQHLHHLKLAVERLGNWPKDYSEYERLNSDVFRMFREDLQGITGLDKCNLKQFGAGRAEASDDLISPNSFPHMDLNHLAIAV
ncbi:hypothetical protein BJX63DRAFT_432256 [Aspergillus granulosus]|uniref:Nephrocystin 3-like N-terminal domain-containing protein n=1 Tax=Aspergillus granulosus TaxID=176169 RepID=A0ABR4HDX2_9EURO